MIGDTITITVNAVDKVLTRINQDGYSSEYYLRTTTDQYQLFIRNTTINDRKRVGAVMDQHNVDFIHTVFPVAPATLSTVRRCFATFQNQEGDTLSDPKNDALGFLAWLSASTGAVISKLQNKES